MIIISDPNRFVKAVALEESCRDLAAYINKYFTGSRVITTSNRIRLIIGNELDRAREINISLDEVVINYIKSGVLDSELH